MESAFIFDIIPIWFSPEVPEEQAAALFDETLVGADAIAPPSNRFLYVDGAVRIVPLVQQAAKRHCPSAVIEAAPQNQGKGAGVFAGLRAGLENPQIKWLTVRDADGDHRANEFPPMLQLGEQIEAERPGLPVLVIGGRNRLDPPLTLYRAVYEELLNGMIQSALQFALARRNYIQDRAYFRQYGAAPDIQSGYKLYNRMAAEMVLQALSKEDKNQNELLRWGAEIPPYVWVVLKGGLIGETRRSTCREQPLTAYGSIKRAEFYAQKLRWAFKTCEISLWNAARIVDNELTYHPLMFDGMGRMELLAFRKNVLEPLKKRDADEVPAFRAGANRL
ncbi:MAG: hypothetical protein AB1656_27315 [Candidatus Omnitrophota bacterium]